MKEVLDTYKKSSIAFVGNSNSLHKLGLQSKKLENVATNQILDVLNLKNKEIIYTSGNQESYSLILNNIKSEKKVLTDNEEFYKIGKDMNMNIFLDKNLNVDNEVYLISTENDVDLKNYNCLKHVSLNSNFNNYQDYDYITIEEDIPFFGCVIKDKNKVLQPIISGGKSTTKYRSGTAPLPLIASFSKLIKNKYKK